MYGLNRALIDSDENDQCHCKDGQGYDDLHDVHQAVKEGGKPKISKVAIETRRRESALTDCCVLALPTERCAVW